MLLFGFAFGGRRGGSGSGGGFTGGIVKPPRAIASATAINPTVVIAPTGSGNILVSPDPAIAAAVAVDPTILSDILVSPAAAIAAASAVDPTSMVFDPADMADIALVIDANDISSLFQLINGTTAVTTAGDPVGFVTDLSGVGNHFNAGADTTIRPAYGVDSGKGYIDFTSSDRLIRTAAIGMLAAGAATVVIAGRLNPSSTANRYFFGEGHSVNSVPAYSLISADFSVGTTMSAWFSNDAGTNHLNFEADVTGAFDGADHVYMMTDSGAQIIGYLDGSAGATKNYTRSGTYTPDRTVIGGRYFTGALGNQMNGRVYAMAVVNRLVDAGERAQLIAWAQSKMPSASPSIAPHALYYSMNKDSQMQYLRQATASQTVLIGPFVDAGDAVTPETGLTIANTDIRLSVNGGNMAAKNSGGGTHDELGMYAITLDATDTATVGKLKLNCAMSGALPVFETFHVVEEVVFDQMFAAAAPGAATPAALATVDTVVDGIKLVTDAQANIVGSGTCDTGGSTTAVIASSIAPSSVEDDQFNGRIIVFHNDTTTTALRGQATLITDYTHSTLTFTVDTLSEAPASGDTFSIL